MDSLSFLVGIMLTLAILIFLALNSDNPYKRMDNNFEVQSKFNEDVTKSLVGICKALKTYEKYYIELIEGLHEYGILNYTIEKKEYANISIPKMEYVNKK